MWYVFLISVYQMLQLPHVYVSFLPYCYIKIFPMPCSQTLGSCSFHPVQISRWHFNFECYNLYIQGVGRQKIMSNSKVSWDGRIKFQTIQHLQLCVCVCIYQCSPYTYICRAFPFLSTIGIMDTCHVGSLHMLGI
jgi:hypothetical protein